jgi:hypothetical protein
MIDIDKMFQLLTELEPDTVLLKRESRSPHGHVEWVREADGSYIGWPDQRLIAGMQALKMLDTAPITLPDGEVAVRFKLSDKAQRILSARQERWPTHRTPYLGEYCWLIIHEHSRGREAYPYLGVSPPDLMKLTAMEEGGSREGETFHVCCHRLDGYLREEECLISDSSDGKTV